MEKGKGTTEDGSRNPSPPLDPIWSMAVEKEAIEVVVADGPVMAAGRVRAGAWRRR